MKREDHQLQPVIIPAWRVGDNLHSLCPDEYAMDLNEAGNCSLFVWHFIEAADLFSVPRAHEVRHWVATLAFLRTHFVERVQKVSQWHSTVAFCQQYLAHHLKDTE